MKKFYKGYYRTFVTSMSSNIQRVCTREDLNYVKNDFYDYKDISDHPCFTNKEYVKRKNYIKKIAIDHKIGDPFPIIKYTDEEIKTWKEISKLLVPKMKTNCCKEMVENFEKFQEQFDLTANIPTFQDLNSLMTRKTGFILYPVAGLINARSFLSFLAFRAFPSTMYIRPYESFQFNGEPDFVHEVYGHVIMLLNDEFCDFLQDLGIASLGASDQDIVKLSKIFWFTTEYGLVKEKENLKVYGAGIAASLLEIESSVSRSNKATYYDLDFEKMQEAYYDYHSLSTNYFIAESFKEMKSKFQKYSLQILNKQNSRKFSFDKEKLIAHYH